MADQLEPGLPAPPAPAGPVGDDGARREIEAIKFDPAHRLHAAWKEQGASHPEVQALYKRAFGTGEHEATAQSDVPNGFSPEDEIEREVAAKEIEAAKTVLRDEWGSSYDEKYSDAGVASQFLFSNRLDLFADVRDIAPDLENNPIILNALALLGERLRKGKR